MFKKKEKKSGRKREKLCVWLVLQECIPFNVKDKGITNLATANNLRMAEEEGVAERRKCCNSTPNAPRTKSILLHSTTVTTTTVVTSTHKLFCHSSLHFSIEMVRLCDTIQYTLLYSILPVVLVNVFQHSFCVKQIKQIAFLKHYKLHPIHTVLPHQSRREEIYLLFMFK